MKYPVYKPDLNGNEEKYLLDAFRSTWISSRGTYIPKFEQECARVAGTEYAVAVSNGTVALHLALLASGVTRGDAVMVPDLTYIASANAALYCGAEPQLVDVDSDTWNIDEGAILSNVRRDTKAIVFTDLYGSPCRFSDELCGDLKDRGIALIEDAAESVGSEYGAQKAGSFGSIGIFSFFGNKTITTGEGGMIVTDNPEVYELVCKLRNQGNSESRRYYHDVLGYNYRMTNLQAAIGLAQIERLPEIIAKKRQIAFWYRENLQEYVVFQKSEPRAVPNYWLVSVLLPKKSDSTTIMNKLSDQGIETRPVFVPISNMPYMPDADTPVSHELARRGVSLPSYPTLTRDDVNLISERLLEAIHDE